MGPKNTYVLMPLACSSFSAWSFSSTEDDAGSKVFRMLSSKLVMVKPIWR